MRGKNSQDGSTSGTGLKDRASTLKDKKDQKADEKKNEQSAAGPEGAGAPPPARKESAKTTAPAGAKVTVGGGKSQGNVKATGPAMSLPAQGAAAGGAARTIGQGTYEPIKDKHVEYGDVPDDGEPLTLNGPISVSDFLDTVAMATNWNVLVTEAAKSIMLEFWITETKPKAALEILKFHDVYYEWNEATRYLTVMTKEEHLDKQYGQLLEKEFIAQYAAVDYIESIITPLLSPKGRLLTDPRTQHIFVWDTKDNIAKMEETVKQLDIPLNEMEFGIQHANVADIEPVLSSLLSPSGAIISDPRTSHILVRDLDENLSRMRDTVNKLDVPLKPMVFTVSHVNAESLLESVEILLSERGTIQMDPRTNSLIVTDLPSRQDKIGEVVAILDKQLETRTWTIKYVDPDDIADRLEELVPEEMGAIVSDTDVHQITVTAIPERLDAIDKYIAAWDTKRRQVQIEAFLVEMSSRLARSLNISWSYFDSTGNAPQAYRINGGAAPDYTKLNDTVTVGQLPYSEPLRNPVTGSVIKDIRGKEIIKSFHGNNIAAVINYLDTHGDATVLSSPRVTVQDGEEALFQNGRQVPYVTSTTYDYGGYGGGNNNNNPNQGYYNYSYRPYNRIDFIEVGTILKVLPRITEDGTILLDIIAEDSDATLTKVISNGEENTIPEKTESVAETQVRVADGQTIAIGGLRKSGSSEDVSKSIPVLADIPVLGNLFKSPSKKISNATLMIFITTTIVDENTQPESEKLADYDQRFAQDLRNAKKTSFGRFVDTITRSNNEISISIGQGGHMHYDGNPVTLDDLRKVFHGVKNPTLTKVMLRKHPRAPEKVISEIVEAAMEANLKVDFDTQLDAFVPNYESMTEDKPVTSSAMPAKRVKPKSSKIPKAVTTPPEPLP